MVSRRRAVVPVLTLLALLGDNWPIPRWFFKKLRKRHFLTQAAIAARFGVTADTYARWEREDTSPDMLAFAGILAVVATWPTPSRRRVA